MNWLVLSLIPLSLLIGIIPVIHAEETKTIFIHSQLVDCVGVGPQKCMLVKDNVNSDWSFFYDSIDGFDFTEGYTYEIQVKISEIQNPPADASSKNYELIEIIRKNPFSIQYCSSHLSSEWCDFYNNFEPFWDLPKPDDLEGWKQYDLKKQEGLTGNTDLLLKKFPSTITQKEISGVRVLEIIPDNLNSEKVLMHIHGGAWVSMSPESTMGEILPVSHGTGMKVISVDYTKSPNATLEEIIDENVDVFQGIVDNGVVAQDIGIFGCSAGGHLSITTAYNARESGYGLPGAIVTMSPMIDFSMSGESWHVVEGWDPIVSREHYVKNLPSVHSVDDVKNPKISPIYGDLTKGMPPSLITVGSKEILLSDSIVFYQEMEKAGQIAKLDVYEGLPHCFHGALSDSSESKIVINKVISWFNKYLKTESNSELVCIDKAWIESNGGKIACVTPTTAEKLVERGWGTLLN